MIRILDITTASDILACQKPHISHYSCFGLKLICEASLLCADKAYSLGIPSAEYTIGVKERLQSRKAWRCLYFFSLCAFVSTFL